MVANVVSAWRPDVWSPVATRGEVSTDGGFEPRASWSLVTATLRGDAPAGWSAVRRVRLDGPLATDEAIARLVDSGHLAGVETLQLASDAITETGVAKALTLPGLTTLRLEGMSALLPRSVSAAQLRVVELFRCGPATCAAALRALPGIRSAQIAAPGRGVAMRPVLDALADRALEALHLAHLACAEDELAVALSGSESTLTSLVLVEIDNLSSDDFLKGRTWRRLSSLEWRHSTIERLGACLPDSIAELSLRSSVVSAVELGAGSLPALMALDCIESTASDAMLPRVAADPVRFKRLGVAASQRGQRVIASLADAAGCVSLELGPAHRDRRDDSPAPLVASLPIGLESLTVGRGWALRDDRLVELLRGEYAAGLHTHTVHRAKLGDAALGAGLSPRLRTLALHSCTGAIDGLGAGRRQLALRRLILDDLTVSGDDLVALTTRCRTLVSLGLAHLSGIEPRHVSAVLGNVGEQLVQLQLRHFAVDSDYGDSLLASWYPRLAELELDERMVSAQAFHHLVDSRVTPVLERLSVDGTISDAQWAEVARRAPLSLHWITANCESSVESVTTQLQQPTSGAHGAVLALGEPED
jgi:hypothetical protein